MLTVFLPGVWGNPQQEEGFRLWVEGLARVVYPTLYLQSHFITFEEP